MAGPEPTPTCEGRTAFRRRAGRRGTVGGAHLEPEADWLYPHRHTARAVQRVAQLDRAGAGAEGEVRVARPCCTLTPAARTAIGPEHYDGIACELEYVTAVRVADPDHLLEEDINYAHHLPESAAATRGKVLGELGEARDVLSTGQRMSAFAEWVVLVRGGVQASGKIQGCVSGVAEQADRKESNPAAVVTTRWSDGRCRQDALQYDVGHNAGQHARCTRACTRQQAGSVG